MKVLVTGAAGIIGLSTVEELVRQNHQVRTFDLPTAKNKRTLRPFASKIECVWGDIRNEREVDEAVSGMDAVVHLAAVIPPLADKKPGLAEAVNVAGTKNVIRALEAVRPSPRLIFTSSIAIYGDRVANPYITMSDPLAPCPHDHYAQHKIQCETMLRASSLSWTILRLSYIVSLRKLALDPIMFDIPLATSFEICDSADVALAIAHAAADSSLAGETFHIAGGERCRISYREYLGVMLELFGVGNKFLPAEAFKTSGFHCGFMETAESERRLHFQRSTLADYFASVKRAMRFRRFWIWPIRRLAQRFLFSQSPYYRAAHEKRTAPLRPAAALSGTKG